MHKDHGTLAEHQFATGSFCIAAHKISSLHEQIVKCMQIEWASDV